MNHTLKDNADDIIETGCYFINLYNESKINFPHKGAFASAGGILHPIGVNHTLKDNADDIIETGCYFINLYNESKINFPHKGAFASLLVCSYKETECVFQHLFCEDGKYFIRAHKQGSWTTWKVVGAS